MILLLQTAGFVLAALLISGVAAAAFGVRVPFRASLVVLVAALAYFLFWARVWQIGDFFITSREQWAAVPRAQAETFGATALPTVNAQFAEWIRGRLRPGETYFIVPSAARDDAVYQWLTYRLLPNFAVARASQADWLVFYGAEPRKGRYRGARVGRVERFAPQFSIARRHAS